MVLVPVGIPPITEALGVAKIGLALVLFDKLVVSLSALRDVVSNCEEFFFLKKNR